MGKLIYIPLIYQHFIYLLVNKLKNSLELLKKENKFSYININLIIK